MGGRMPPAAQIANQNRFIDHFLLRSLKSVDRPKFLADNEAPLCYPAPSGKYISLSPSSAYPAMAAATPAASIDHSGRPFPPFVALQAAARMGRIRSKPSG